MPAFAGMTARVAAVLATNETSQIFAANRATGHIALGVAAREGRTRRTRVHEDGSLRVRFPNVTGARWRR